MSRLLLFLTVVVAFALSLAGGASSPEDIQAARVCQQIALATVSGPDTPPEVALSFSKVPRLAHPLLATVWSTLGQAADRSAAAGVPYYSGNESGPVAAEQEGEMEAALNIVARQCQLIPTTADARGGYRRILLPNN